MNTKLQEFDHSLISFFRKFHPHFARFALFVVYFWFGILKILDTSPANPLVMELQEKTLPFLSFHQFIIFFSLYEMLIGILFLFSKFDRLTILLFVLHMGTTFMPLLFLPQVTWQGFLTPTMEGQYIIKNLVLIALVLNIGAKLESWKEKVKN
ncbi:MAG: hypothetical protein HY918_00425 [Candidatus Doudnabacteria bacterium]|nr:hypothetical protein [Candidatus Doudnabacteria bacterium]